MKYKSLAVAFVMTSVSQSAFSQTQKIYQFPSNGDTTVLKSSPTKNYGKLATLTVDGSPVAESFLKFRLANIVGTVKQAKLRLFASNGSVDGPAIYLTTAKFGESSLTYNTRPARSSGVLDDKASIPSNSYVEYDVTAAIKSNGDFGFILAGEHDDNVIFDSRTGPKPPVLIITAEEASTTPVEPPPETPAPDMTFTSVGSTTQVINGESYGIQSALKDWSIAKSSNGGVYRVEVRQGENRANGNDPDTRDRSELKHQKDYPVGTEMWVSYSFMIEKGDLILDDDANISQWHPAIVASPPVAIQLYKEKLRVKTRHGSQASQVSVNRYISTGDVERGRWYNLVHRVRFNAYGDAVLQVWLDGKMIVDVSGVNIGFTDSTVNYWKFGIYRSTHPNTLAVRFANMEVGTNNLSHRIASPLKISP